jgi:PPOX class probable F420-dependent enzyme
MFTMSRDQWWEFASAGTRTGKIAMVRKDGTPHVVPVWFVLDSADETDYVVFTTDKDSVKGKVLRRDPRFGMCVDDQVPPFSFVTIQAEAAISEDLDEMLAWSTKLGARYMGAELAESFGKRNAVAGELLVRGRITKVTAIGALAD